MNAENILGTAFAALLNSLWECAAIALLVWVGLRFLPRINVQINAATRCAVWWAVLAAVVLLPMAPQSGKPFEAAAPVSHQAAPLPADQAAEPAALAQVESAAAASSPVRPTIVRPIKMTAGAGLLAIFAVWSALSLFRIAQLTRSYRYLRGIKQRSYAVSQAQQLNFNYWLLACGIDRTARLVVSSEIVSPMAVGFRRPAVIVPETLINEFTADELDHVILHELAHIARYDDWTNLFGRLIGALLPVHPVAVWLVKRIEQEREIACDDWVVAMTGEARPYAASLTRLFELCSARRRQVLATGMADRASHLGERIEALLRTGRDFAPRVSLTRVALGAAILAGLVLAGARAPQWIAFAQEPRVAPLPPIPPVAPIAPVPAAPPIPAIAPVAPLPPVAVQGPTDLERNVEAVQNDAADQLRVAEDQLRAGQAQLQAVQAQLEDQRARGRRTDELRAVEAQLQAQKAQVVAIQAQVQAQQQTQQVQQAQIRADQGSRGPNGSFLAALVAAGYGDLSVDEIIELRSSGVSADFLRGISQSGWGKLPAHDLVSLARNGVSPSYLAGMRAAGFKNLTPENVIRMAQHGVRPELFQEIHALGFGPYSPQEAADFTSHGIHVELFRALKDVGMTKVEPAEIMEAANNGLRGDNVRAAREFGPNLTLKQIIRLKQAGVI